MNDFIEKRLNTFQEFLGYKFSNPRLLLQALTTPHFGNENKLPNYEILETLGDSIVKLSFSLKIYEDGIKDPGELTKMKQVLESNRTFIEAAKKMELWKFVFYSKKQEIKESSILADIFEAIAGALYLDSNKNLALVNEVFIDRFIPKWDKILKNSSAFNKNQLLEYLQERLKLTPTLKFEYSKIGPQHNHNWKAKKPKILNHEGLMIINLPEVLESDEFKTKKDAEKDLSRKILNYLIKHKESIKRSKS